MATLNFFVYLPNRVPLATRHRIPYIFLTRAFTHLSPDTGWDGHFEKELGDSLVEHAAESKVKLLDGVFR